MRLTTVITAFAVALLLSPFALADVVPRAPMDCSDGSKGDTCHGGPYCRPSTCTSDADCTTAGESCQDVPMCIGTIDCGGLGGPFPVDTYEGPCNNNAPCVIGSCETRKVCAGGNIPPTGSGSGAGDPSTGPSSGSSGTGGGGSSGTTTVSQGCGCSVIGDDSSQRGWLLLVAALMLLARRRD